jgi:hypothetical protein
MANGTGFEDFEGVAAALRHPIGKERVVRVPQLDDGVDKIADDGCKCDENEGVDAAPPLPISPSS